MTDMQHDRWRPSPGQLAAYADGELSLAEQARVEAWLAGHPEGAVDVEGQRQLVELYRAYPPSEPDWAGVLGRVEAALGGEPTVVPAPRPSRPAGRAVLAGLVGAAAAAVLLAVGLWPEARPPVPPEASEPARNVVPAGEPLPVVTADEVHIERMDDGDRMALVVGDPPVREPLELLGPEEVQVSEVSPDGQGRWPRLVYSEDDGGVPMVVMPAASEP